MKGLFAGFQINVLPYKENIPKMKKLCLTSHVVDDKMEYTYITSFLWFATRYMHIICINLKVCLQTFKCYIINALPDQRMSPKSQRYVQH